MFRSPIAKKLSLYFAVALLIFSLTIGSIFVLLFRNYTLNMHKTEMENRANSIASTLSGFMDQVGGMRGGMGAYMRFIGDIAGTDVWVVDSEHNLITVGRGSGMMGDSYSYTDLPQNAGQIIDEVYLNKTVFSDDFSSLLSELTLTVGVPIKDSTGGIVGCVLLHSPVHGITEAWGQGVLVLLVSIVLALAISFLLSLWLSKRFTDPITAKEAADALRLEKVRRLFGQRIP
jgi:sensor histidine kinase regulating citrate/malate metabolism